MCWTRENLLRKSNTSISRLNTSGLGWWGLAWSSARKNRGVLFCFCLKVRSLQFGCFEGNAGWAIGLGCPLNLAQQRMELGQGEGIFSTMACLKHYKQHLFHHESWFKTTALGHKNQLLTTSSGTAIPSMFPSNVDSMINIHPLSSLIISLHSFLCNFPLTGVVFVEQLVGKTERAELLYTSCEGKKPPQCSVSAQNDFERRRFFPSPTSNGAEFSIVFVRWDLTTTHDCYCAVSPWAS